MSDPSAATATPVPPVTPARRPTLDDVARAAGVARATASRALSGSGSVSPATSERVRAAAARLNFTPHQAARALASAQAQTIALVIPEPDAIVWGDPFLSYVIKGISEACHDTKYQVLVAMAHPDDPPAKIAQVLRPGYVDGAIMVSQHGSGQLGRIIDRAEVPIVHIGRPWGSASPLYVDVDNWQVGHLAARHLIAAGARRVACIAGPSDMSPVHDRTAGWRQTLLAAGLTPGPLTHAPFTRQGGETSMRAILAEDPGVDAVFAQSDLMAAGAIRVLQEAGVAVPAQVRVVGVDNTELGHSTTPPLTTVTNPASDLARNACRMLLGVLDGVDVAGVTPEITHPELVVRASA